LVALATSSAVKAGALALNQQRSVPGVSYERVLGLLSTAQAAVSEDRHRALLYQAEGHLGRTKAVEDCILPFEYAIALLPPKDPLWTEVSAELLDALIRSGFQRRAVARGLALLNEVSASAGATELAMLRTSTASALVASGRTNDALAQLERALDLVRGYDPHTEMNVRLHLVRAGLVARRWPIVEENLRIIHDRSDELDPTMQADLDHLTEFVERLPPREGQPSMGVPGMLGAMVRDDADDVEGERWREAHEAARVYVSGVVDSDPGARTELMHLALGAIADAVDAARAVGDGATLVEDALLVSELAVDDGERRVELAERFWSLIIEGTAGWLTSTGLRERVVHVTRRLSARMLADQRHEDQERGLLSAEDAIVWLARGHEVTRAPLLARVVQPQDVLVPRQADFSG
jgi:hypothetical protein